MTTYNLATDHAEIKKLIKQWELRIDAIVSDETVNIDSDASDELAEISGEMMSVNI